MRIEYFHASKYGNGAKVAEEFKKQMPTDEEMARWQRVIPIMNELLQEKGLFKAAEGKVLVSGLKGPLEEGWQKKVEAFVARIPIKP